MATKKKKTKAKTKQAPTKGPPDFFPFELVNLSAEIESIIPELARTYHEQDGDMQSVVEEIRDHLNGVLDFLFNDLDQDLLENILKKEKVE